MHTKQENENKNLHNIYAILSENKEITLPENIREEYFKVPFIDHNGETQMANGCLFLPVSDKPVPLVYFSYYKVTKESFELANYLKEGWAVASPFEEVDHNIEITRDGLVSNSSLLYELRHRPEIDPDRIALVGGSAGGYTAMMLSALHLFPCCTVASGAFANVYFNYRHYAPYLSTFNLPAAMALKDDERKDLMTLLSRLPIPYGIVFNTCRNEEIDARIDDLDIAAAVSPSMLGACYSNPLMEIHNTSDILVPVDQITKSYTYEHVSSDLPDNFKIHLADYDLPEDFDKSFVELLPKDSYTERLLPVVPEGKIEEMPFDNKVFQINIVDEGEPQSHGSHGTDMPKGISSQCGYIKHAFAAGNINNFLTNGKLQLLMERYAGISIQMPPHEGDVYGSTLLYQKEVVEVLSCYIARHPEENVRERLLELGKCKKELSASVEDCLRKLEGAL